MPDYWRAKDERQYQAILKSCKKRRGKSKLNQRRCKRMAAATVNKQRRKDGVAGIDQLNPWPYIIVIGGVVLGTHAAFAWLSRPRVSSTP